jgi:hypothetical protein
LIGGRKKILITPLALWRIFVQTFLSLHRSSSIKLEGNSSYIHTQKIGLLCTLDPFWIP